MAALGASGPAAGGSVATLVDFDTLEVQVERPEDATSAVAAMAALSGGPIGLDGGDPSGRDGPLDGLALSAGDGKVLWLDRGLIEDPAVAAALTDLLGVGGPGVAFHDGKPLVYDAIQE